MPQDNRMLSAQQSQRESPFDDSHHGHRWPPWWPLFAAAAAACAAVAVKRERRYNTFGAAAANALFTRLRIGFIK